MSRDLIQAALKDILAEKQDHVPGSIAHQRMERAETALRSVQLPLSPAMCALIESGQEEDDDAGWLAEHQARKAAPLPQPQDGQALHCPFCGGSKISDGEILTALPSGASYKQSECQDCGAIGPAANLDAGEIDYGDVKAIAAWNRRAGSGDKAVLALPAGTFQQRVQPWMMACFGETISNDLVERNHRFLEEALELVQSTGCTQSEAHQLVDYVFGRPVGEPVQEVGGVMVTLAALCLAAKMDMHAAGEIELVRIWMKVEQIRAKQATKPKHSPLPIAQPSPAVAPPVASENCPHCDGTGDVHDQTGQWLGTCWPCADANLLAALGETAKGCPRFESSLPQPSLFEGHFSTAHLTQQQDELFSLLSPDSVLRLVHLARAVPQPADGTRPADCSGDPQCCPQNEGHGCQCSALAAKDKPC
ncbi:Lar family restriction alleviation protein [Herbaspirillum huttiense]|uniref:Lar family restriction alleviation protein n=1 Tax=Herbaspirillum huttiense TaxID=863372 RepID=UPI0031DF0EDD